MTDCRTVLLWTTDVTIYRWYDPESYANYSPKMHYLITEFSRNSCKDIHRYTFPCSHHILNNPLCWHACKTGHVCFLSSHVWSSIFYMHLTKVVQNMNWTWKCSVPGPKGPTTECTSHKPAITGKYLSSQAVIPFLFMLMGSTLCHIASSWTCLQQPLSQV